MSALPPETDTADGSLRRHQQHLEQARAQVLDLLARQSVEKELLTRTESRGQDVVSQLVARQHLEALRQRLSHFHPADIAFVLEGLAADARDLAWTLVRPERRGAVLIETSEALRRALVRGMPPAEIAQLAATLDPEDIAAILGSLPEALHQQVLAGLDRAEEDEVRRLLSFPDGTVGALMDLDFLVVREDMTLEATLGMLRRRGVLPAHTNQVFVVDAANRLCGLLSLTRLLLGAPATPVREEMNLRPVYFHTDDPAREAGHAFEKYDLISAPVVNLHRQVVGRLTVDVVLDDLRRRAHSEDLRKVGLSEADQDLFAPVLASARRRWPWLGLNLATAFLASRVIDAFEPVIAALVALAALMPIVASIGGNTGNQTVALVIRGLALGRLGGAQLRAILLRELSIATVNGAFWGVLLGCVTWVSYGDPALAAVIALALLLNMIVSAAVGVLAPVLLQRAGRDPAMGASILLTATTDSLGFLIFLGLAAAVLV